MHYIFFGSSEFAKIILNKLLQAGMKPFLVITTPPKPKGRKKILSPTPVHFLAEEEKISVLTPENLDENFINEFKKLKPDFVILTAYGKIIPSELLTIPPKGFINLHPSLLPKWRGATPIQSAILNGDTETGVSLFVMDEQIDHGPIIAKSKCKMQNAKLSYEDLRNKLAVLGASLIIKAVPIWLEGKIKPVPQDHSLASYCHKILPQDEKIDWENSAIAIDRKVRALNPFPGVYTKIRGKNGIILIKIISGYPLNDSFEYIKKAPGQIFEFQNISEKTKALAVKCGEGIYVVEHLKPAGKNSMDSESFLRGNKWILNKIFET